MNLIQTGIVLWDGAMGSLFQERGLEKPCSFEELNIKDPDLIFDIHKSYLEAGAVGITTNTFGANRIKLSDYGLGKRVVEINRVAAGIAKEASKKLAFVSGSIGPTGKFIKPLGELGFNEAVGVFEEQVGGLVEGGVDLIKIETMMDIRELKAAILAAKNISDLPVIAMMTFQDNVRTILGTTPESFAVVADGVGADVIGINCSVGPARMVDMLSIVASVTAKPLIAQPNAGIPGLVDGKTYYPMTVDEYSGLVEQFLSLGVHIIAGCCGTTPEHIRNIRRSLDYRTETGIETLPAPEKTIETVPGLKLASRSRVVSIESGGPLLIVGERINPTGKKTFGEELRVGRMDSVIREAREQEEKGADILDVNVGAPGVNEEMLMKEAVYSVNLNSTLPVMIDSANSAVIEKGLMAVDGLPIINSVTGETKKLEEILPLAEKFGSPLICLLFDEEGIPDSPEGRLRVAMKILKEAEKFGVGKEKLILDCLATTVSSSQQAALCTLNTVDLVRKELGLPVILGISNVSFGLPARHLANRSFLPMAVTKGLNLAIINPHDKEIVDTVYSCNLLWGKDESGDAFVQRFTDDILEDEGREGTDVFFHEVRSAVKKGLKEEIIQIIDRAFSEGADPLALNNDGIVRGLEEVGKLFNSSKIYLPQVIAAAETATIAFERIKKELGEEEDDRLGRILLATVEGDIHDIGKNIVGTLLSNHGFEVIDIGINVPAEKIVEEAVNNKVDFVGLSALMTTTMIEMKNVISLLKTRGIDSVSIIGGAVVSEQFAKEIGADIFAKDAMDAVDKLKKAVLERKK